MCGRFTIAVSLDDLNDYLHETYDIEDISDQITSPRYNVAPGQDIIVVLSDRVKYRVGLIKWGFVPPFSTDEKVGYMMINAKSETLHEKKAFKPSFETKRCVIIADGFFEWAQNERLKQAMRITVKNQKIFSMAGLWTTWTKPDGSKLYTCTIITTAANKQMSKIHERMPVILDKKAEKVWLNPDNVDLNQLKKLLNTNEALDLSIYPVTNAIGSPAFNTMECISPIKINEAPSLF